MSTFTRRQLAASSRAPIADLANLGRSMRASASAGRPAVRLQKVRYRSEGRRTPLGGFVLEIVM